MLGFLNPQSFWLALIEKTESKVLLTKNDIKTIFVSNGIVDEEDAESFVESFLEKWCYSIAYLVNMGFYLNDSIFCTTYGFFEELNNGKGEIVFRPCLYRKTWNLY